MKSIRNILVAIMALVWVNTSYAQTPATTKTDVIKVSGNCESCKARIEKALKVDGISKTVWNVETKQLTVTYNSAKFTNLDIQKRVAAVGHDTEKIKAEDKVYNSLPGCCKYRQ